MVLCVYEMAYDTAYFYLHASSKLIVGKRYAKPDLKLRTKINIVGAIA